LPGKQLCNCTFIEGSAKAHCYYSLLLTGIILFTTVPLVKNVSFILLQAAPPSINVEKVRRVIAALPGLFDLHDLHIWQLSDTKAVASVHFVCENTESYLRLAKAIRRILHKYGVHSTTLQPEFIEPHPDHASVSEPSPRSGVSPIFTKGCLMSCDDLCELPRCCPLPDQSSHSEHQH
jgi:zinc transporter 1